MGTYSTVADTVTGEGIQFKTGNDTCRSFRLGDRMDGENPSTDIYDGWGRDGETHLVVVRDYVIIAVVRGNWEFDVDGNMMDDGLDIREFERSILGHLYGMRKCDLDWVKYCMRYWDDPWWSRAWEVVWPWSETHKRRRRWKRGPPSDFVNAMTKTLLRNMWPKFGDMGIVSVDPMPAADPDNVHYLDGSCKEDDNE